MVVAYGNIFVLFVFIAACHSGGINRYEDYVQEQPIIMTDEARLHNDLFLNRTRTVFPMEHGTLNVTFGIALLSVVDIDIADEAIVIQANINQAWVNPLLTWDNASYNGITHINVDPSLTWVPDIYVYANIEDDKSYNGLLDTFKVQVKLGCDGNHSWNAPVTFRMSCTMNVKDYPFERQTCPLLFSSFTYTADKLNIIPAPVATKDYGESTEWIFVSMIERQERVLYPASTVPYTDVTYTIVMKRKPLYLLLNLVLPNMILVFMTVPVFTIPVSNGERAGFVVTILLAITWFLMSSITTLSSGSEGVPLFSWFLSVSLVVIVFLMLCLCYSTACYYAKANVVKLPLWVRHLVLNKLTRFFDIDTERQVPQWRKMLHRLDKENKNMLNKEESDHQQKCLFKDQTNNKANKLWSTETPNEQQISDSLVEIFGQSTLLELNDKLDTILSDLMKQDDAEWLQKEWKLVSVALDTLFLYIFSGLFFIVTFSFCIKIVYLE